MRISVLVFKIVHLGTHLKSTHCKKGKISLPRIRSLKFYKINEKIGGRKKVLFEVSKRYGSIAREKYLNSLKISLNYTVNVFPLTVNI